MKKKWKVICLSAVAVAVLLLGAVGVIASGMLVRPTNAALDGRTEIPQYDVLEWQYERELEILADYQGADYVFDDPYVILDPYRMNPLGALVMFEASEPCEIEVIVAGDDEYTTYRYTKSVTEARAEIPIIGLYAGRENTVTLNAAYSGGGAETTELKISTDALPVDFQIYTLEASVPEKMEPGITLFVACFEQTYTALVDSNAQVRGYLSNKYMAHGTSIIQLQNGRLLAAGDEYKQIPYNMTSLWEFNWLGKIFKEYEVPNAVHHGIQEMPNGDILAVSNHVNMLTSGTREDVVVIVDRVTGQIKKEYHFRDILDEHREPYHHFHPPIINPPNVDWMHTNAVIFDEVNNAVIVSSPTQSMVVSINADTSEINWILGPHEGYEGGAAKLVPYLLDPVGDGFEWHWCQHYPMILPDFDGTPDTIDILLFDNGQSKSFTEKGSVPPEDNYSRSVHYRVNHKNMTVEQIWQYGKERGSEGYATFLGSTEYLKQTGNRLTSFGGQLRLDDVPTDDIVSGVIGDMVTRSRVVEVTEDGEVVFEVSSRETQYSNSAETYQAKRIGLYSPNSFDYSLGKIKGERLGSSHVNYQSDMVSAPNFYLGKHSASFNRIYREGGRLIIDGNIYYDEKAYLISKPFIIFRSKENTYVYEPVNGLNGRFFTSVDLTELEAGEYQIDFAAAVVKGNDANGKRIQGHFKTDYKVTVR